jgi:hypothetical protein
MPFFSSILLAASFLALPADTQPIPAAVPVPATLSPNNCGTPDTPKPCISAKKVKPSEVGQKISPTTSQHK